MKKTVIHQIETQPISGFVCVRFAKLRLNDDGTIDGEPQWHRAIFLPDDDIDTVMANVNVDLTALKESPVTDFALIHSHAALVRTPVILQNWANAKAAAEAQRAADAKAVAEAVPNTTTAATPTA